MMEYYFLFVFSVLLTSVNTVHLYKKYQLTAGTSLQANTVYLIINGVISALMPGALLLIRGAKLQCTPYSMLTALSIVVCSAMDVIARFKAYSRGKIAMVNTLGTVGTIVLSCVWGLAVLKESLTFVGVVAIGVMLAATVLIFSEKHDRADKGLLWLYVGIILLGSAVSILSKQHQVETQFATVDTLSFSVWIGLIRTVLFSVVWAVTAVRGGIRSLLIPAKAAIFATASSVFSGSSYILTLITGAVLPIVITSPLGTGLGILLCTALPWILYREKLNLRQMTGILLSLIGSVLFFIG